MDRPCVAIRAGGRVRGALICFCWREYSGLQEIVSCESVIRVEASLDDVPVS